MGLAHFGRKGQFFPLRDDNPTTITPFVNWALIAACVLVFVVSLADLDGTISRWGFTPASFSLITLFTSIFLHAGLAHIAGNMWFLYIFGDNVEERLGHAGYALFYLIAGLGAGLAHFLVEMGSSIPAVGASGAISGVLGAYLVFYPHAGVYVSGGLGHVGKVSAWIMLLAWFGLQFVSGVLGLFGAQSGVAFWAHIGGFVLGVVLAYLVKAVQGDAGRTKPTPRT